MVPGAHARQPSALPASDEGRDDTVAGKPSETLRPMIEKSILKQAGIEGRLR